MAKNLFEADNAPFVLIPYNLNERNTAKSVIRHTKPDYHMEIKRNVLKLAIEDFDDVPFSEIVETGYDLNYGDLFLLMINAYDDRNSLDEALFGSAEKIYVNNMRMKDYLFSEINDYRQNNKKGPILISPLKIHEISSEITKNANALSLCRTILEAIEIDEKNEFSFLTFLSMVFGTEEQTTYNSEELRNNLHLVNTFLSDVSLIMHFGERGVSEYYFNNFADIVLFDMYEALNRGIVVKACENCGAYFVPSVRSDEKYCCYPRVKGRSCKDVGYENKINSDELMKTYRTIYKTQNARKQRNRNNINDIERRFDIWKSFAKEQLLRCQNGLITVDELRFQISGIEWMKA